jgi:hypothetical protein
MHFLSNKVKLNSIITLEIKKKKKYGLTIQVLDLFYKITGLSSINFKMTRNLHGENRNIHVYIHIKERDRLTRDLNVAGIGAKYCCVVFELSWQL